MSENYSISKRGKTVAKLIILRGNSGSGKSTVAKALQKKFGANTMLLSQDMIRREILKVKDGVRTPACSLLIHMLKYGRKNCEIVILEGILDSEYYRELFECAMEKYGANIYAYYYDLPFEETLRRHETKPNCNEFGERDMRRWWKEKDFIGSIPEKILTKEMGLDETVDMIYDTVS